MHHDQSTGFSAEPVSGGHSTQHSARPGVSAPQLQHSMLGLQGAVGQLPSLSPSSGVSDSGLHLWHNAQQEGYSSGLEGYQANPATSRQQLSPAEWGRQAQLQHLMDQQALLSQLQTQMQLNQALGAPQLPGQQGTLASLLSQQLQAPPLQEPPLPAVGFAQAPMSQQRVPGLPGQWPGNAAFGLPANAAPGLSELQGMKQAYLPLDDKKLLRGHGHSMPHGMKGRPIDSDFLQGGTVEKLRREVARLHNEVERMEKEVVRQKALRENERVEFTDAKERVRHSWAADRDDFARVKLQLKTKNAEHHAQSGRLSQQLKEVEAVNRGLRDLCTRHGLHVPPELEVTHSKHHGTIQHSLPSSISVPSSSGSRIAATGEHRSASMPNNLRMAAQTQSQSSQSERSCELDAREQLAQAASLRLASMSTDRSNLQVSQPASPTSAASAVLSMMQQLPMVVARGIAARPAGSRSDLDQLAEGKDSSAAAHAAAQAASALGRLAAALSMNQTPLWESALGSRPSSPMCGSPHSAIQGAQQDPPEDTRGQFGVHNTDLNRTSLQAWVKQASHTSSDASRSPDISGHTSCRSPGPSLDAATAAASSSHLTFLGQSPGEEKHSSPPARLEEGESGAEVTFALPSATSKARSNHGSVDDLRGD